MIELAVVAGVVGVLSSVVMAGRSAANLFGKKRALDLFRAEIRGNAQLVRGIRRLRDMPSDVEFVLRLEKELEAVAKNLDQPARTKVLEGLEQPSLDGRKNYIESLAS